MDFNKALVENLPLTKRIIKVQRLINTFLNRFGMKADVAIFQNNGADMVTLYQKMNLFHLLLGQIDAKVEGDVVEMGCYDGETATLFQKIIQGKFSDKKLHLFDNFQHKFGKSSNIKNELIHNFRRK